MPLAAGTRLGPYEIVAPIGAGGMGEVYRARDAKLSRDVAVKVLPEGLSRQPEALARFEREAKAIAALSHPNILAIFDFGSHDGTSYAVTELLEGETLRARMGGGALGLRKAVEIAVQIAQGLAAAHDKGVVHRDLKPENVFLTRDGGVRILDFGLARRSLEAGDDTKSPTLSPTEPGAVMGTVGYMSPEQVRGQPADHRSDIFAFGAVLHEMLSGRRAFQRETAAETMTAVLKDEPEELATLAPGLPPALERIVHHCLEKRPEERFQSARDLAFDLLAHSGSVSGPRAAATPLRSWPARIARAAAVLALAALVFEAGRRTGRLAPAAAGDAGPKVAAFTALTDEPGVERQPSLSPDGKSVLYVAGSEGNSDIFLLRVGGRNPVNLTADCRFDDSEPAFSADGERILFRSEREGGGIFVMGSTGESVRRLTDRGSFPSWSPDGKEIVVSGDTFLYPTDLAGRGGGLQVVDLATGRQREVAGGNAHSPRFSPSGRRIAYWGLQPGSGQRDIWTVRADGSDAAGHGTAVTSDAALDWAPAWSRDGRFLYFSSNRGGSMNLWRVRIDEASGAPLAEPEPLTTPSSWSGAFSLSRDERRIAFETLDWRSELKRVGFDPVAEKIVGSPVPILRSTQPVRDHEVSPDGEQVAFTRAGTHEDLFVARMDGSQFRRLTDDDFRDRGPAWSPDGQQIAFYSDRSGQYEGWSIHPDGSALEPLTKLGRSLNFPSWSPDGRKIAFTSTSAGTVLFDLAAGAAAEPEELPAPTDTTLFWTMSWSPDGQRLGGIVVELDGRVSGLAVYSLSARRYERFPEPSNRWFRNTRWLGDSRRLLVRDSRGIRLLDTATGGSKLLLEVAGYMVGKSVSSTRDDRWITFTETAVEGDIWLATLE